MAEMSIRITNNDDADRLAAEFIDRILLTIKAHQPVKVMLYTFTAEEEQK